MPNNAPQDFRWPPFCKVPQPPEKPSKPASAAGTAKTARNTGAGGNRPACRAGRK